MPVQSTLAVSGQPHVQKSSFQKKDLFLAAGLVASIALGVFLSPEIGITAAAAACGLYLLADICAPSKNHRTISENRMRAYDQWDVNAHSKPAAQSEDPEFAALAAEFNANFAKNNPPPQPLPREQVERKKAREAREAARAESKLTPESRNALGRRNWE